MIEYQSVYDFIKTEEAAFHATQIEVVDGMSFSFYETVRTATLYKNGQLLTGKDDDKPVKNITLPLLRLQYRSEGFDVKDIDLFIDDAEEYYKSFLVKKFHDKWARENDLDTFIDDIVESYVDYGAALVKDVQGVMPEVVRLQSIAFCDQTDVLAGPLCIKHSYSPDQLRGMAEHGWNKEAIEQAITLAGFYKVDQGGTRQNKTPGKYIEVYELHGVLPKWWLTGDMEEDDAIELQRQLQIVTFYKDDNENTNGITLFSGPEKKSVFDVILRDPIYGRALGLGGAEELFEAQVWTTYDAMRMKGLLDAAAKVLYQTTDSAFANRNQTSDVENGEILVVGDGKNIAQINTTPVNISLFERSVSEWYAHAQELAGSSPYLMGDSTGMGGKTAFRSIAALIQMGEAIHEYRQGKIAVFFEKLYRTRFLDYIAKEITTGTKFLSELSLSELQEVAGNVAECEANDTVKEKILNGEVIDPAEIDQLKEQARQQFMKGGSKKLVEILKGELKDVPLDVEISIKSKQQDLQGKVQTLTNILQMVIGAPQILQDPTMAKLFNEIIEYSGLEPLDFSGYKPPQPPQNPQGQTPNPAMKTPAIPVPQIINQTA